MNSFEVKPVISTHMRIPGYCLCVGLVNELDSLVRIFCLMWGKCCLHYMINIDGKTAFALLYFSFFCPFSSSNGIIAAAVAVYFCHDAVQAAAVLDCSIIVAQET